MDPWYKIATPRKEVREGRSFNPDEFAIHLEQVIAGTAPDDYKKPEQFFARTCFTRALRDHSGMVLRRLNGETANTAPVMTLITQFGGGKTHTLAALYHMVNNGPKSKEYNGIPDLISQAGISEIPFSKVAIFVGNAWDPMQGKETPWIDIARQLAGDNGVKELGPSAITTPPGTDALGRVFAAAKAPVLVLFDEVLNFLNRHRGMADQFHAFIQNLTVAMTGTTHGAAVISLPRSQVEMTDWDMQWQEKITKVVRRVAKDLIANDETEISEVLRRRLFDDIGPESVRKSVAKTYADWCFDHRAQLPPEWTAVDTASTDTKAKEHLRKRFESCYPFHPATLSVFHRKWQALPQYQQTRGTLAMLAQWISWAYREGFTKARREPLITLGSAPLEVPEFRSVVLGQLGESRLVASIDSDISGINSHAKALDSDTKGSLKGIYSRVGVSILFESSGGQIDKTCHLPELRFALGEPDVDTTSIDSAAFSLEDKSYFIRRIGSDGFKISHQPTMKKVVNDRRASLDEETEIKPAMKIIAEREFRKGASIPIIMFPENGSEVPDSPRLTMVVLSPEIEWTGTGELRESISKWMVKRGDSGRLYPGSLVWCVRKKGKELRDKVELWLAWRRVAQEVGDGTLGADFDRSDRTDIQVKVRDSEEAAQDEVWGGYRFIIIADNGEKDGIKPIDLGAGHSSGTETLCGRVIGALKSQALLNESVGASYIERKWPPALKDAGSWPLDGLRKSFLDGSLTRLLDPDTILKSKIVEFIAKGDFGLASNLKPDGSYDRLWYNETISPDEVTFEKGVFLILKSKVKSLQAKIDKPETSSSGIIDTPISSEPEIVPESTETETETDVKDLARSYKIKGFIPPEIWNRLGSKIIPKLRTGSDLKMGIEFSVMIASDNSSSFEADIKQIINDLNLNDVIKIELV